MEEKVKVEDVKVEVVEEKKKFFTKKKLYAIGGGLLVLGIGAVAFVLKGKNGDQGESQTLISDTTYEPTTNSETIE